MIYSCRLSFFRAEVASAAQITVNTISVHQQKTCPPSCPSLALALGCLQKSQRGQTPSPLASDHFHGSEGQAAILLSPSALRQLFALCTSAKESAIAQRKTQLPNASCCGARLCYCLMNEQVELKLSWRDVAETTVPSWVPQGGLLEKNACTSIPRV